MDSGLVIWIFFFFPSHLLCLWGCGEGAGAYPGCIWARQGTPPLDQSPAHRRALSERFGGSLPCSRVPLLWNVSQHLSCYQHTFQNSVRNRSTQHPTGWASASIIAVMSSAKAHNWKLPPNSWNILIPTVKYVFSDLKLINIYALQKHSCNINGLCMRDQTASACSSVSEEPPPSGT